jgi:hypothetical protein
MRVHLLLCYWPPMCVCVCVCRVFCRFACEALSIPSSEDAGVRSIGNEGQIRDWVKSSGDLATFVTTVATAVSFAIDEDADLDPLALGTPYFVELCNERCVAPLTAATS